MEYGYVGWGANSSLAARRGWARLADMSNASVTVLYVYIALLVVGGVMGMVKAGSKVSLITSVASAAVLGVGIYERMMFLCAGVVLALAAVFVIRYNKGSKFMPSGFMVIVSTATLVALAILR